MPAFGQTNLTDSTHTLKELNVTSNRVQHFSSGTKTDLIDSLSMAQHRNQNLSDLLMDESPVFIKSYGQGALATTSFRGGSANHTAILWNGFNLNSPMNGQLDLSLVPVNFSDAASIQYGGTGALWGSSAVGGVIHLNNHAKFNKGLSASVNLSAGSFDNYHQQASMEISKKRFVSSISVFNTTAKNNFKYTNIYSPEKIQVIQSNAELKSHGVLSENYYLINENQKINLFFWYQQTDRNIPPTMLQQVNRSNQLDDQYRITSEWKHEKFNRTSFVRAAYFNESLLYSDKTYFFSDLNRSQLIITEAESKINLSRHHFVNIGLNNTFANAVAAGYDKPISQNRTAVFASYLFTTKNEKLKANVSARQEVIEKRSIPFTYSAGMDLQLIDWLSIKTNFSKVYRTPTFNELYWTPGGNPNLLPESGFSEEIGLKFNSKKNFFHLKSEVTVYNRQMENWIIWLPSTSYWSPQNMLNVRSRGMETHSTISARINKVHLSLSVLTNYVVSTNQLPKTENDDSFDKQLIYVPMYSGHAKINLAYWNFTFSYRHSYTGYRYTSTDNTQYLVPFNLGSVYGSYKFIFKNSQASVFLQINNLWGLHYQVILNRAMPQRNINAGISLDFNKPNKHN